MQTQLTASRGASLLRGDRRSEKQARAASLAPQRSHTRGLSRRGIGRQAGPRSETTTADGSSFVYDPADFLTIPSLDGIPNHIGAIPALMGDFLEALRGAGIVHPENFTGDLKKTLEICTCLWSEEHTGREDGLKLLSWWCITIAQDIESLECLYDAADARKDLTERFSWQGGNMAAFALEASSDRRIKLGDAMSRLEEALKFLRVRPVPALSAIMGTINRAGSLCGAWTPGSVYESWQNSDWQEEEESDLGPGEWAKIPGWFFSWKESAPALARLARKLQPSETMFSGAYWIVYYAAALARELERWDKDRAAGLRDQDYMMYTEYPCAPSMLIDWNKGDVVDALYHYNDYELECLYQAESNALQWLCIFDPGDAASTKKAVYTMEALMRLIGRLDALLEAINTFAQNPPHISVPVQGAPLLRVFAQEVRVHA